ncbi:MAG TPA: coproporphyrinogen dehydrogenase HemZ [Candidatus Enterenecus merdae]|nr:coproporphyrinogen dehydrogenase HemZ [Candidatus Enterenecus merdae]
MDLYLQGHDYRYAVEQTMMVLFPGQLPRYPQGEPSQEDVPWALVRLERTLDLLEAQATLWWQGRRHTASCRADPRECTDPLSTRRVEQRVVRLAFYDAGVQALGAAPPWGALTGVRPVKLPTRMLAAGAGQDEALSALIQQYRVRPDRAQLALACAQAALEIRQSLPRDELSLYLGIPFCPTRCAYCSFISSDVRGTLALVEPYVDALCREIALAGSLLSGAGLRLSTVYMGGGTPTTLSAGQLDRVLTAARRHLPMDRCREFTVEAGRPDTITGDKLRVLRAHGVQRISINPQTMDDSILCTLNRGHTADEIRQAMALAEDQFGGLVNMDLIAGLPGDSPDGFAHTLEQVLTLSPANLTVHTLALKKGARLREASGGLCAPEAVAQMLLAAQERLSAAGYQPYYLYRQKYMSGSFENVGWCLPGTRCDYNVLMMEELQTVLALGAGGITKLVNPDTGRITRLSNPKYPKEYLAGGDRLEAHLRQAADFQRRLAQGS